MFSRAVAGYLFLAGVHAPWGNEHAERSECRAAKVIVTLCLEVVIFVVLVLALELPGMRKYDRLCDYSNKDAMLAAEPGEVGVDVFNLGFRCGWQLNYLVFRPIKHINTLVFCLKNMI